MKTYHDGPFDFAFNGTMSQAQVDELLTLDFVGAGKNLAIIGNIATGKTTVASAVQEAAKARGMSTYYMWDRPMCMFPEYANPEILAADLLVIDEFNYWMREEANFMFDLLNMRGSLGRSTVATILGERLRTDSEMQLKNCPRGVHADALRYMAREKSFFTPYQVRSLQAPDPELTLAAAMQAVGIDLAPPAGSSLDKVHSTDKWLHIYTGTKSYREVLLGRRAA